MKENTKSFWRSLWSILSHLNVFKYEGRQSRYTSLTSNELSTVRGSSLGHVILRRDINIYRMIESRVERLNDYRTALILSSVVCAAGATFFYFLVWKPEMLRAALRPRLPQTFWEHFKNIFPKLWTKPKLKQY